MNPRRRTIACVLAVLSAAACQETESASGALSSRLLHLADVLEDAEVESAGSPAAARARLEWNFAEPRAEWRTVSVEDQAHLAAITTEEIDDALRFTLEEVRSPQSPLRIAGLAVELEDLAFDEWETVLVRARSSDRFAGIALAYNLDDADALPGFMPFFQSTGEVPPLFSDGSVQTYAMPLRVRPGKSAPDELRSIGVLLGAPARATLDILQVTLVPRGAGYLQDVGARPVDRDGTARTTLFAHAPARIAYPVEFGPGARLDFGLTANPGETITYRVSTVVDGATEIRFEESITDETAWHQRSVDLGDLSDLGPVTGRLVLEATSDSNGAVALFGAPILSDSSASELPNVVFYVIDGGDADLMSLYGYGRPTTPFLSELAQEGVLFERAHANSSWTQPSTASFMTGLHHSVLGGLRRGMHSTPVPVNATTMAECFRLGGYGTSSFTSNPNAGRLIGLDRGMDTLRDGDTPNHSTSSLDLQDEFWSLREAYPAEPFWVHFQTTDVHEPNHPPEGYAQRFVSEEERLQLEAWDNRIWQVALDDFGTTSVQGFYDLALERAKIDRKAYFGTRRGLYDETMVHQDDALKRFVGELKEAGVWENTILVIGSDHGHPAGTFARFGRGEIEPQPEPWQGALFDAYATRIPLLVLWPGHIEGGRRIAEPVSMIDVMPTLLELAGLPRPEVLQGQSLAPLLLGEEQDLTPVILDEFRVDEETGEMIGNLEIVDGRWGASLEIGPRPAGTEPGSGRYAVPAGGRWGAVHPFFEAAPSLLLYDLEADPFALGAVNDAHPGLVEKYRQLLLEQWDAHRALSQRFQEAGEVALSPDQLEQLRALGYIE